MKEQPYIINGGLAVDDRGEIAFANEFDFQFVKRFYMVSNHKANFIRAWHAHKNEAKYVTAVCGAAVIGAVKIDNWDNPSKDMTLERYILSAKKPQIIFIPPGYANGFMSLTDDCKLIFYSTSTLQESAGDDIRYDARYWDIWQAVER